MYIKNLFIKKNNLNLLHKFLYMLFAQRYIIFCNKYNFNVKMQKRTLFILWYEIKIF